MQRRSMSQAQIAAMVEAKLAEEARVKAEEAVAAQLSATNHEPLQGTGDAFEPTTAFNANGEGGVALPPVPGAQVGVVCVLCVLRVGRVCGVTLLTVFTQPLFMLPLPVCVVCRACCLVSNRMPCPNDELTSLNFGSVAGLVTTHDVRSCTSSCCLNDWTRTRVERML